MSSSPPTITVDARPGALTIDPSASAVIVVDMQNDFGAEGGMFALAGIDISGIRAAIGPTARTLEAARRASVTIVYLKMGFLPDLSDAGAPDAPNWLKHQQLPVPLGTPVVAPDGTASRVLIRDTWSTAILPDLAPAEGDLVVYKHRYSGFYETELDDTLRSRGIKNLIFTGCTTSICVESTVRDAMFRDYTCLLLADCMAEPIGNGMLRGNHEATLLAIEALFGWVTESPALVAALKERPMSALAHA